MSEKEKPKSAPEPLAKYQNVKLDEAYISGLGLLSGPIYKAVGSLLSAPPCLEDLPKECKALVGQINNAVNADLDNYPAAKKLHADLRFHLRECVEALSQRLIIKAVAQFEVATDIGRVAQMAEELATDSRLFRRHCREVRDLLDGPRDELRPAVAKFLTLLRESSPYFECFRGHTHRETFVRRSRLLVDYLKSLDTPNNRDALNAMRVLALHRRYLQWHNLVMRNQLGWEATFEASLSTYLTSQALKKIMGPA